MGILTSGLLGPVQNKVGPTVSRLHKNRNVITGLYKIKPKAPTDKQLEAQAKFGLLNSFLSKIEILVKPGFKKYAKGKTEINAAYVYNYPHAFIKKDEQLQLNFPELKFSRGRIASPEAPKVTAAGNQLDFSWSLPFQQYESCQFSDLASILVYNADNGNSIRLIGIADRYSGGYKLDLSEKFIGRTLHCYISFTSSNGRLTGDSTYVGYLICPPSRK